MGGDPEKTKKIIIFTIIGVVALAVILVVILAITSSIAASKNNLIIDGNLVKLEDGIVSVDEYGNAYFSIERIAPLVGYDFYNGEYGKATEDKTKCYVKSNNELASFSMDSTEMHKLLLENADSLYEKYLITQPVKRVSDKLYVNLQGLQKAFNIFATYDAEKNVLSINTLQYLYNAFNAQVKEAGFTSLAEEFVNKKAILSGLLVVVKDRQYYGVIDDKGNNVIGTKYTKINFMESTLEFLTESNRKFGVLTRDGSTRINLEYDELKVIEGEEGLYLAKQNGKYGVLKRDGSKLLHIEYEGIGVDNVKAFPNEDLKNPYVLLDSFIPVKKAGKWGFYGIDGTAIIEPSRLTTLGCIATTNTTDAYKNVLIIPESEGAEGIVVGMLNSSNATSYGIYSLRNKKPLTPTTFSKIYRDIVNGEVSYLMQFGATISKVKDRLTQSATTVTGGNSTVNVNELITPTNTATDNSMTNTIGTNPMTNTVGTTTNPVGNTTMIPTTPNNTAGSAGNTATILNPYATNTQY